MSSWGLEPHEWDDTQDPGDVPTPSWKKEQWDFIQKRHDYDKYWKYPFHPGDEVVRVHNGEPGHVMEVIPVRGYGENEAQYKVTSPSNPVGYTLEWANYLKPYSAPPKAPDDVSGLGVPNQQAEDYYRDQQPLPPGTSSQKVGWQVVKNPFAPAPVEWQQGDSWTFEKFVNDVIKAVGINPDLSYRDFPEGYHSLDKDQQDIVFKQVRQQRDEFINRYHDAILGITRGMIPKGQKARGALMDQGLADNYQAGIKEVASQLPILQQNQIPRTDMRADQNRQFADQYTNGIQPKTIPGQQSLWQPQRPPMSSWRSAGHGEFQEDAAQSLEDYEALARDIMRTLPEEEWPKWVKNQANRMVWGPNKPVDPTPYPHTDALDARPGDMMMPDDWAFESNLKKVAETPANYTDDDPLDMQNAMGLVNDLDSQWWTLPPDQQRQAIANAFRAALTSPRQNLQWNSIVYQDMQELGPEVADPDVFENHIRAKKSRWDEFGQQTLDAVERHADDPEHIALAQKQKGMSKYMPGIWQNVRNAGIVGPYIEPLREAALKDISQGGSGQYFRQELLELNIPGIGPKIAAFVWLLLCPRTSKIATIDVHMMRALGQKDESPASYADYLKFEQQLDEQRKAMGYDDIPLGAYQWALWDWQRTPGYHQDHTPLRPVNPTPWWEVDWAPQSRVRKQAPPPVAEGQQSLFGDQSAAGTDQDAPMVTGASWKMIL